MKIYPDPELPDIEVRWFEGDCRDGTGDVALALIGLDSPTFRADLTVPCADMKATFADVARERFRLEGSLRGMTGEEFSNAVVDLDLRNGFDERAELYFGGFSNVRVAWTFDMDATCASLAADFVEILFSSPSFADPLGWGEPCERSPALVSMPDGVYTVVARARTEQAIVAVSPPSAEVAITFDSFTDVGTLVMTPCGAACPEP